MSGSARLRLLLPALLALALAGCASDSGPYSNVTMPDLPPPATAKPVDPGTLAQPRWAVVLAAGDPLLGDDDNAAAAMNGDLVAAGTPLERIHLFGTQDTKSSRREGPEDSSDRDERPSDGDPDRPVRRNAGPAPGSVAPARLPLLLRALLSLGRGGSACLVYLASSPDGSALKILDDTLSPEQLDRALGASCAAAPTVVIISGCRTGGFADTPMTQSNRLIITASSGDAEGFGCGRNRGLTTFDECLLGAMRGAARWTDVMDRTVHCVTRRETLVGQPSVAPKIFVGSQVAGLAAPWHDRDGIDGIARKIEFRPGIGRFSSEGIPYYSTLATRNRPAAERYRRTLGTKALALSLAGTMEAADAAHGETADDVARLALQRCEWQSSGACILYARNDTLVAAENSGLPALHPTTLARSGTVDPATVPFIRDDQRPALAAYVGATGSKALALGPASGAIGVGEGATPAEARRRAFERCRSGTDPCVLFAVDNQVVLGWAPQSAPAL